MITFEYDYLLSELKDLRAERVWDASNGDYVQIPLEFQAAITISPPSPGTGFEKAYLAEYTTWDQTGASSGSFIAETDSVESVIEQVRAAYAEEERRMAEEDRAWSDPDHDLPSDRQ